MKTNNEVCFEVDAEYDELRIDKLISMLSEGISRSYIQSIIKDNGVLVNGKAVKSSFKVSAGDEVRYTVPEAVIPDIQPENIPLDIVYEDSDVILVNKPKGMVVHPASGNYTGTLVNALMFHCKDNLSGINGVIRPGIVHRIDKDTTGIIIACKNDNSHRHIAAQLKEHSVTRRYEALVYGCFNEPNGTIDAPIGRSVTDRKKMSINTQNGKNAVTHFTVLEELNRKYSHVECVLETGRTHQIRVHMKSINHPLLGDIVYGPANDPFKLQGQTLHAGVLGFIHPTTEKYMEFSSEKPEYFTELIRKLRG